MSDADTSHMCTDIDAPYSHDDEKTDESADELLSKPRVRRAPVQEREHVVEEEEEESGGHGHGAVGPHYK